jgi:hypothetical protein
MSEDLWGVTGGEALGGFLMLGYHKSSATKVLPTRHFDGVSKTFEFL